MTLENDKFKWHVKMTKENGKWKWKWQKKRKMKWNEMNHNT
jgi:hypothetical protein